MRYYLSFSDEEVFKGMAIPEETSAKPTEEADPQSASTTPVSTPEEEATMGTAKESIVEKRPQPNSLVGKRCYIPSNPWWLPGRSPIC